MAEPIMSARLAPVPPPHGIYQHPLICWGSVIGGTLVAIALGVTLNILGVAIGATALNPFAPASEQAPGWTIGSGLWVIFSNLVAIQMGAYVATRAARWPDHHDGMLQGMMVWALSFVVALAVLGVGVGGMLAQAAGGADVGQAVADAAQAATGEASGKAREFSTSEADAMQDAAALTAWWAFATMVLGAVGAVAGGKLGSGHPDWHARSGRDREQMRATTLADRV